MQKLLTKLRLLAREEHYLKDDVTCIFVQTITATIRKEKKHELKVNKMWFGCNDETKYTAIDIET